MTVSATTTLRSLVLTPVLSLMILGLWLALAQQITIGQIVLGSAIALAIPRLTAAFWPDRPHLARPGVALRLLGRVLGDIVTANFAVARRVVGPIGRLHPAFVEVPLDLRDGFVASILGSIVSLTPGTVSIEIDRERWILFVHALDDADPQTLIDTIKRRYEAPLREAFAC
ncbi:MAG: Na+/H+ antiporter subunit E [Methylacidiphilales bacterium]|nr:Na+/H+ antiporter subunit E [Candidatus Methylacidiphilales bacterium]